MSAVLNRHFKVLILTLTLTLGLGGCGVMQGQIFNESFWAGSPFHDNAEAELGIAEMAKGNYITAEAHFKKALRSNPRDIDALLGAGILYQNTGQMTKAREMYEAVLALRPDDSQQFVVWNAITTKPASQIASVNLSLLESGGVTSTMQRAVATPPPMVAPGQPVTGAPAGAAMLGRAAPQMQPGPTSASSSRSIGALTGLDGNIMSRFSTLKALRDQGLITAEEYAARRRTNVGALLPLTSPPPAAGLERSVPTSEQIGGRLRAIGRALEMRAISVSQHAAERNMILDAMMPAAPVVVANPSVPPKGLMEAADSVRRLEKLRNDGFISSDEYARERQAIELSMRPATPPMAKAMPAKPVSKPAKLDKSAAKMSGPKPAVHLASYRSMKQAQRGWAQIKRAHKAVLGRLKHEVSKVNLGKKGVYYRLKAGPFKSAGSAKSACGKLKRRRQFCEPSMMGTG
ncbi:MAG: tetratricopeptide repeat protein [Rhodospirillaceae bacterium]|nr:tetratricopeptide repeat protein [Rhodospirillaceae bacterium]